MCVGPALCDLSVAAGGSGETPVEADADRGGEPHRASVRLRHVRTIPSSMEDPIVCMVGTL